jgi:hypothetical protein
MAKPGKAEKWAGRSARLSTALRENLKRRKAQARERELARQRALGQELAQERVQETGNETGQASPLPEAETGVSPEFRRNPVRE